MKEYLIYQKNSKPLFFMFILQCSENGNRWDDIQEAWLKNLMS